MFVSKEIYKACIYTRLSKDDGDKPESDSIANQKSLIRDFISRHPEIQIVSEKSDDGYSGVNFERPAFEEMMEEVRSGKVDCIVVKDLSRFGRNYIESGNYIERVFPFMGVRFIAINDNYDSAEKNHSDSLIIPFKNLINDAYCKDISVKIRSQLEIKRKKGEFIGAFAVYGYLKDKDDHNKLVVDEYAAEVVRMIFRLKIQGMSQGRIADRLNEQGILCPMEYKLSLGMNVQTGFRVYKKARWSAVTVTRILANEIYTGVLIQGKSGTPNYKVKKNVRKDESEWIRVEDSHEPVIDKATFDMVQKLMKKDMRSAPNESNVYLFSGYLICGDCKQSMIRKTTSSNKKKYVYFVCSTDKAKKGCTPHRIAEKKLEEAVLAAVRTHICMVLDMEATLAVMDRLPQEQRNVFNYDAQIVRLKEEIERHSSFKLKLYENLSEGLIDQEEYFMFKKSYTDKIREAEQTIAKLEAERTQTVENNRQDNEWMEVFKKYRNLECLERKTIVELIEQITVYGDGSIDILFKYQDKFDKKLEQLRGCDLGGKESSVWQERAERILA